MKKILFLIICCIQLCQAQDISILRTFFANDFRDWQFYDFKEREIGTLRARWGLTNDYSQWDIRIGESSGSIVLRWQDRPDEWEIRLDNQFISAAPTWPGQIDSWRITKENKTYYFNLIHDPEGFQWVLEEDSNSLCYIYNVYYDDPREWEVKREQKIEQSLLITVFFLASYYTTPK